MKGMDDALAKMMAGMIEKSPKVGEAVAFITQIQIVLADMNEKLDAVLKAQQIIADRLACMEETRG